MPEILNRFVASKYDPREDLRAPFLKGDYIYATDGCISIRVPKFDSAGFQVCDGKYQSLETLFPENCRDDYAPLPALPEQVICNNCNGSGEEIDEEDGEMGECFSCNGDGFRLEIVGVGITKFKNSYLHKIVGLPGLKFAPHPTENALPAYFVFDGGEGLLMPVRF